MTRNVGCWRLRLAVLTVLSWSSACATVGSEPPATVCPPVVEYSRAVRIQAAEELALLPAHSAIARMLADYAVMREQARGCGR